MATLPWRDHLAQGLGGDFMEGSYDDMATHDRPHPLARRSIVCCHVDIPTQWYAIGEAVVAAQSRALGISNLRVGPRIAWAEGDQPNEVKAMLGNHCTSIFMDPTYEDGYAETKILEGQAIVVHRNEAHAFWPMPSATQRN